MGDRGQPKGTALMSSSPKGKTRQPRSSAPAPPACGLSSGATGQGAAMQHAIYQVDTQLHRPQALQAATGMKPHVCQRPNLYCSLAV